MKFKDPKAAELQAMELFAGCTPKELAKISSVLTETHVGAGETLTREGRFEAEQCFLIVEGEAAVSRGGIELALLGPGALVGEIATIKVGARTATVTALSPLRTFVFDPRTFLAVVDTMPTVRKQVMRSLASRLRSTDTALAR